MNEQFLEALRTFGTLILNGSGSEEEATKGLELINTVLVQHPNIFPILKDENNREIFEHLKNEFENVNFDKISLLDAPKFMALIPKFKQINFYN